MGSSPGDSVEEQGSENRVAEWFLLDANRRLLAAVLLVCFYVLLVAVVVLWPASLRMVLTERDPSEALFQALVTALITAVTLVITINQLVLSQELGPVGDQRERMEGAVSFRDDVAEYLEEPASPAEPASFLQSLVLASRDAALDLGAAFEDHRDPDLRAEISEYVENLAENASAVADRMQGAQFGSFELIRAAIGYNYSWKLYRAEYLRNEHADALEETHQDAFEELISVLRLFAPAREHFKTLYFQWELTDLSRAMLYTALPALVVPIAALVYLDTPSAIPGATVGVENVVWVLAAAVTVSLVPFAILLSYMLRIATVAKRTLAMGPFVLRKDARTGTGGQDETNGEGATGADD